MVSLETIEREIDELEARETSYRQCERLAWLYVVRDHLLEKAMPKKAPSGAASVGGSEFLDAANGRPYADVLGIVDEHLETVRLMYPKTYQDLISRIMALKKI